MTFKIRLDIGYVNLSHLIIHTLSVELIYFGVEVPPFKT